MHSFLDVAYIFLYGKNGFLSYVLKISDIPGFNRRF